MWFLKNKRHKSKGIIMKKTLLITALISAAFMSSATVYAEGSVQHFGTSTQHVGQSAVHSGKSVANAVVGSTKFVSGVVAIPFKGVGAVANLSGSVSESVGGFLWEHATGQEVLEVSEETVTAGPAPMVAVNN